MYRHILMIADLDDTVNGSDTSTQCIQLINVSSCVFRQISETHKSIQTLV